MKNATSLLPVVALAVVLASCGGSSGDATTTSSTSSTTTSTIATTTSATVPATTTTTTVPGQAATSTTAVVQQDLTALGYFDGPIDGIAGEQTRSAIAKFQSDVGIEADGEFGPQTDAAMYPLLQKDVDYVEGLQEDLTELELYTGPIDGDYGKGTQKAVEGLQALCELEETGEIEIATRICLFEDTV